MAGLSGEGSGPSAAELEDPGAVAIFALQLERLSQIVYKHVTPLTRGGGERLPSLFLPSWRFPE
jgi:hypothetical protein